MKTSEFTDKKITELCRSLSEDFSDHEDDSDSSFRFRPQRHVVSSHFQNQAGSSSEVDLISIIDRIMEAYSKNLLRAIEGLSVRISQLKMRTRKIEDSVGEIKDSSIFNHGRTEKKLKELEIVLTEVQVGIRDLRDKQDISEVQIQMAKLQLLKSSQKSQDQKTKVNTASSDQAMSSSSSSVGLSQPQYPTDTNIHRTPPHQNHPPPIPIPIPIPTQIPIPSVHFPTQPQSLYPPFPFYTVLDPRPYYSTQQHPPPLPRTSHNPASPNHFSAGFSYPAPQTRYPNTEQASLIASSNFGSRSSAEPKPRELPRALPMAHEIDSAESGSGGTRNTVPVTDVVDSVVAMGFRRDLVRATVKKLTENGLSVDLNVVLDKLMNSESVVTFGR